MRRPVVALLVCAGVVLGGCGGRRDEAPPGVPSDFVVAIEVGGRTPRAVSRYVELAADGRGQFERFDPLPHTTDTLTFTVTPAQLGRVWTVIRKNRFFTLRKEHSDPRILDGDYMVVSVRAEGRDHWVRAVNTSVPQLDRIAAAVGAVTPPAMRVDPPRH